MSNLVKRICAAITCSSSAPKYKLKCFTHKDQFITHICTNDDNGDVAVCSICRNKLEKSHKKKLIPLQNFLESNKDKNFHKLPGKGNTCEAIEKSRLEALQTIEKMEFDILQMIEEVKYKVNRFFDKLQGSVTSISESAVSFDQLSDDVRKSQEANKETLSEMISLFEAIYISKQFLDLNVSSVVNNLKKEANQFVSAMKENHLPKLKQALNMQSTQFSKMKVQNVVKIPQSKGILYESSDYIPQLNSLICGYKSGQKGSIALVDLNSQQATTVIRDVHRKWINHIHWVEKNQVVVTCSNDHLIKVFKFVKKYTALQTLAVFRGHKKLVRCIKMIPKNNLLVSGGDDPDLKLWDLRTRRMAGKICTKGQGSMDGTLAYIEQDDLVGAGFRSGSIKFFNIIKRNLVFQIQTGHENFYTYGLQYLENKNMIVGRIKEQLVKMWTYDKEEKTVKECKTIKTKGKFPDCIVSNEDNTQLVMTTRDNFLEVYDFNTEKFTTISLSGKIDRTNSINLIKGQNKISVCDYQSDRICILE